MHSRGFHSKKYVVSFTYTTLKNECFYEAISELEYIWINKMYSTYMHYSSLYSIPITTFKPNLLKQTGSSRFNQGYKLIMF